MSLPQGMLETQQTCRKKTKTKQYWTVWPVARNPTRLVFLRTPYLQWSMECETGQGCSGQNGWMEPNGKGLNWLKHFSQNPDRNPIKDLKQDLKIDDYQWSLSNLTAISAKMNGPRYQDFNSIQMKTHVKRLKKLKTVIHLLLNWVIICDSHDWHSIHISRRARLHIQLASVYKFVSLFIKTVFKHDLMPSLSSSCHTVLF